MSHIAVVHRPSVRNTVARVGWAVLTVAAAGYAVFVASEPMYQINNCEIEGVSWADCSRSIYSTFGPVMILVLAIPVLLCLAPVLWTRRPVAVAAAAGLIVLSAVGQMNTPTAALFYFLPVAVIAVILAVVQGPRRDSTG